MLAIPDTTKGPGNPLESSARESDAPASVLEIDLIVMIPFHADMFNML
jgi:hypothetical protein